MDYRADLRDVRFVLFDLLHIDELLGTAPFEDLDRETIEQVLDEAEKFAREQLAPLNPVGDQEGCHFADGVVTVPASFKPAYQSFCELGFLAAGAPAEEGGLGLPEAVILAMDELFVSANCAFTNYPALTRACANMLRHWGTPEQKERYLEGLLAGRWQGTMCLTEPGAGSFVGAVRCIARPTDEGDWLLEGTKSFITSSNLDMVDNNIHFVLARTPDAPMGIKGISLFLVEHMRMDADDTIVGDNDVRIVGIEEKMGIHGSVTTTLSFGDEGRCHAQLIGTVNQGLRAMFQIMNEERVQVGLQGQAVGAASYYAALDYARERVQGIPLTIRSRDPKDQVAIIEHPDVRRTLLSMKATVEGCRAMLLKAGAHLARARAATDGDTRAYHDAWVELLTPICKSYGSDQGFEVTVLAMQVLGGAGYVRESGVEQLMRDSRIASVYEGTNGIQAMDLLFRKATMKQGALMKAWDGELQAFIEEHGEHGTLAGTVARLEAGRITFRRLVSGLGRRLAQGELDHAALVASAFLRAAGNLMVAWLLVHEAVVAEARLQELTLPTEPDERRAALAHNPAAAHLAAKLDTARFFVHHRLVENEGLAPSILTSDTSALEVVFP